MKTLTLGEYVGQAEDVGECNIVLRVPALVAPKVIENLRKLRKLELLTDEAVLALLGQAPIDPLGLYGALKSLGVWALQPLDFTAMQVLAKKGDKPVALMRIDLLSDDVTFVALKDGQLQQYMALAADDFAKWLHEPGMTSEAIMVRFTGLMKETVEYGMKNA